MVKSQTTSITPSTHAANHLPGGSDPVTGLVVSGTVTVWTGAIGDIPTGWVICDGTLGTPDLRDQFVVGAGTTYAVNDTGGEATHALTTAELAVHSHQIKGNDVISGGVYNPSVKLTGVDRTENTENAGSGDAHENRPPYFALAYIMKT